MPNWCSNYIKISGEESNMKPIHDFFVEGEKILNEDTFVMSTLVPEDGEFEKIKESGEFLLTPYTEFWGCKWDFTVNESNCDITPTLITLSPSTAWSPPEPFCKRLSEKYGVDVTIIFSECGNDFAGRGSYSNGEEIESVTYTYREGMYYLDNEVFWSDVDSDLEWMFCENPNITLDEVLGSMYPFVTEAEDIETLTEIYNEYKVDETTGE